MANKRTTSQRGEPKNAAPKAQEARQPFNLATMSGIFPGTRTQIFQRIQVQPLADMAVSTAAQRTWVQLLWPEHHRCVAYLLRSGDELAMTEPLFALAVDANPDLFQRQLQAALQENGYHLRACGSCHFWQPLGAVNPDQLSTGQCGWRAANPGVETPDTEVPDTEAPDTVALDTEELPPLLSTQSHLALPCRHWQAPTGDVNSSATTGVTTVPAAAPMRRAAEEAEIRFSLARRLWRRFLRRQQVRRDRKSDERQGAPAIIDWAALLVERSGMGAGTESCFACQGRIANLGALTVATVEDDKQTFSIWRCRNCYSLYLNNWVDRWERLDSLETEESYYRIAPAEAFALLTLIHSHAGGEHPNHRHERTAERQLFLDFIADRVPLSHQIRQGR